MGSTMAAGTDHSSVLCCSAERVEPPTAWDVEDIVRNILQWLPPVALSRARLVCRAWNMIALSQRSKICKPCCYHFWYRNDGEFYCHLFDPSMSSWVRVSGPNLHLRPTTRVQLMKSGGNSGLVAFFRREFGLPRYELWVGNPMTNKWTSIIVGFEGVFDGLFDDSVSFHFIVTEGPPVSYKIVAFYQKHGYHNYLSTLIYDSTIKKWSPGCTWRQPSHLITSKSSCSATYNGCIYFVPDIASYFAEVFLRCRKFSETKGLSQMMCYSPEHDRFDVIGPPMLEDLTPQGIVFLRDNPLPFLAVLGSHTGLQADVSFCAGQHRMLRFYELQQDDQGWCWKETSKFYAVTEGFPIYGSSISRFKGSVRGFGDAEHMYVGTDGARDCVCEGGCEGDCDCITVAIYEAHRDACRELPVLSFPRSTAFGGAQMCSFLPHF